VYWHERERCDAEGEVLADTWNVAGVYCFALSIWFWAKRMTDAVCKGVLSRMRRVERGEIARRLEWHERCDSPVY
jgi:hypothetical protein